MSCQFERRFGPNFLLRIVWIELICESLERGLIVLNDQAGFGEGPFGMCQGGVSPHKRVVQACCFVEMVSEEHGLMEHGRGEVVG